MDKVDQSGKNIFQEKWLSLLANQQLIKINMLLKALDLIFTANVFQESKMFQQTMFFYLQLFIQYPGDLFLPAISLPLLPRFAITCNCKSASKVKSSLQVTLMDLLGNTCFLQQVQKVTSVSSDWLILIRVVYFFCGNYD